jgi:hypothetical protein
MEQDHSEKAPAQAADAVLAARGRASARPREPEKVVVWVAARVAVAKLQVAAARGVAGPVAAEPGKQAGQEN